MWCETMRNYVTTGFYACSYTHNTQIPTQPTSVYMVTGQLADKPAHGQSSRGLDNSRTGQLSEMFDLKFGVYNSSKCYFGHITPFIRCQCSMGLQLGLGLGLMYK